jgi:hypothetical protein
MDTTEHGSCHKVKHSWSAVFAGALVGTGLAFLFNLLSLGIGLTSTTQTVRGVETLAIVGLIWLFIGSYIIFFIAGWVTGKIIRKFTMSPRSGALHGFVTWVLALLISVFLMGQISKSSPTIITAMHTDHSSMTSPTATETYNNMPSNPHAIAVTPATEMALHTAGIATLSTFFIIFAGALGSTLGGFYAIKYYDRRKEGGEFNKPV